VTALYVHEQELEGRTWRLSHEALDKLAAAREASMERARAWLANLVHDLPGAARVSPLVVSGSAARKVPALSEKADLVVMGKQGRSMLGELFLGSVTRRTLGEARCDVLVVPSRAQPGRGVRDEGGDTPPQR
jgi:nucleotide-binding universal stress UspA family protein